MEHKGILDLKKLTNDKSGFRDWKVKKKDALVQIFRGKLLLKIMAWIETPGAKLTGTEDIEEIMQQAEDEANAPQNAETSRK